jgi:predicted negative regulator of RcsB-dependent stress response
MARAKHLEEGIGIVEKTDHLYRDLWRGLFLCVLGRVAMQQGNREAASAAFQQSAQHVEGRSRTRCAGHVRDQALAGLARATGQAAPFDEAMALYEQRQGYDFSQLMLATKDYDLVALSKAAAAL